MDEHQGEREGKAFGKHYRIWISLFAILLVAIIAGAITLSLEYSDKAHPLEIILPRPAPGQPPEITTYVSGAVAHPGIYLITEDVRIRDVLRAAGGITDDADSSTLKIHIPTTDQSSDKRPQRININTAEVWLLDALPGVGEKRAQDIIDYRAQNGSFHRIEDLLKVPGIGPTTFERMKNLITVVD
jgi:competence protein ComEA